jgi:hypothetical protein
MAKYTFRPETQRAYFAGLALQGLMACSEAMIAALNTDAKKHGDTRWSQTVAREAVECADALMAALESQHVEDKDE